MESQNFKYKLTETGIEANFKDPQYSISYMNNKGVENAEVSYNIISALIEDKDIILEVNTSLLIGKENKKASIAENFLKEVQKLNLVHTTRKIKSSRSKGVMYILFAKTKEEEGQEIIVYIPNDVWKSNELYTILPQMGIRYYVVKKNADSDENAKNILDNMPLLDDQGKIDGYNMIIFDISSCCQMGIMTGEITSSKLKNCLIYKPRLKH